MGYLHSQPQRDHVKRTSNVRFKPFPRERTPVSRNGKKGVRPLETHSNALQTLNLSNASPNESYSKANLNPKTVRIVAVRIRGASKTHLKRTIYSGPYSDGLWIQDALGQKPFSKRFLAQTHLKRTSNARVARRYPSKVRSRNARDARSATIIRATYTTL